MSLEASKTSHQSEVIQLERLETVAMQTYPFKLFRRIFQVQQERDELYRKFVKAIHEVQQKSNFKNLLLEKKLNALADTLEKKEAQLNEVLSASNLDPTALTVVTRKLEVQFIILHIRFLCLLSNQILSLYEDTQHVQHIQHIQLSSWNQILSDGKNM